jgi:hypothetical protein
MRHPRKNEVKIFSARQGAATRPAYQFTLNEDPVALGGRHMIAMSTAPGRNFYASGDLILHGTTSG